LTFAVWRIIRSDHAPALCLSVISAQARSALVMLKGKPVPSHRSRPEGTLFRIMG
jgi:hypothetical protein